MRERPLQLFSFLFLCIRGYAEEEVAKKGRRCRGKKRERLRKCIFHPSSFFSPPPITRIFGPPSPGAASFPSVGGGIARAKSKKRLLLFPPLPIVHFSLSAVEHEDKRRQFSPLPPPLQSTMVRLICVSFPLRLRFSSRKMPLSVSPRSRRVIA